MIKKKSFEIADNPAILMNNPLGSSAVNEFYFSADMNCSESILRAANKIYSLKIDKPVLRIASGFGGGMGAGHLCGSVSGCIMAIGMLFVKEKAHESEDWKKITADFIERVNKHFKSLLCSDIKNSHYHEELGCSQVVYETAEIFWKLVLDYSDKRVR